MSSPADRTHSLFTALERARGGPVRDGHFDVIPQRFLAPGEVVHLALEGNGWSWVDPLVLVTDRRVLRLRRGMLGFWRLRGEIPAQAVVGASLRPGLFLGRVQIRTRDGGRFGASYDREDDARRFVAGIQALLGTRPPHP